MHREVSLRVDAAADELALDVGVPVVLDLVVGPSRQLPGDDRPSCTYKASASEEK